jgi:hypothetical protein
LWLVRHIWVRRVLRASNGRPTGYLKCGQVMKEDPFWALMGDAYDGLKEGGEAVNIKAGRAAYYWFQQRIKKLRLAGGPDTRYRDSTVELDESLSPGVMVLSAGGESCTLVLTA